MQFDRTKILDLDRAAMPPTSCSNDHIRILAGIAGRCRCMTASVTRAASLHKTCCA